MNGIWTVKYRSYTAPSRSYTVPSPLLGTVYERLERYMNGTLPFIYRSFIKISFIYRSNRSYTAPTVHIPFRLVPIKMSGQKIFSEPFQQWTVYERNGKNERNGKPIWKYRPSLVCWVEEKGSLHHFSLLQCLMSWIDVLNDSIKSKLCFRS